MRGILAEEGGEILISNRSFQLETSKLDISPLARSWRILFKGSLKPFKEKYQRKRFFLSLTFFLKPKIHFLTDAEVTQSLDPNADRRLGELTHVSKSSRPFLSAFTTAAAVPVKKSENRVRKNASLCTFLVQMPRRSCSTSWEHRARPEQDGEG